MTKARKNPRSKKTPLLILLMLLLILVGLVMIVYPKIETYHQEKLLSSGVAEWYTSQEPHIPETTTAENSEELKIVYPELLETMQEYNLKIYQENQSGLVDAWSYQANMFDLAQYGLDTEIVGLIRIPAIDVELPLYLGATYDHLSLGFAQLSQTSMPIGGDNTNCVVACHRGWRGAAYMRDADKLEIGDTVYMENFWETLVYQVCETKIIEPNDVDQVLIQPGRDLLTIVTCTPYGVGSHRLLIYCERKN